MAEIVTSTVSPHNTLSDLPTTLPYSEWPKTLVGPIWLYDTNHPETLYASVVEAGNFTTTIVVENTATPDFAPQTLTRIGGGHQSPARPLIWAGEHESDGTTTRWGCDFNVPTEVGKGHQVYNTEGAICATTTGRNLKGGLDKSTTEAECFVLAREAFALTTAGIDKLRDEHEIYVTDSPNDDPSKIRDVLRENYEKVCTNDELKSAAKTTAAAANETGDSSNDDEDDDDNDEDGDSAGTRHSVSSLCVAMAVLTVAALLA